MNNYIYLIIIIYNQVCKRLHGRIISFYAKKVQRIKKTLHQNNYTTESITLINANDEAGKHSISA